MESQLQSVLILFTIIEKHLENIRVLRVKYAEWSVRLKGINIVKSCIFEESLYARKVSAKFKIKFSTTRKRFAYLNLEHFMRLAKT
jgi:hypothetical protein